MAQWLSALWSGSPSPSGWPPTTLHAHEMLFGTVVAVVAGFLLTAVPNWTSTKPVSGRPLAGLATVWLAGRIAMHVTGWVDARAVAIVDIAFLPALAATVGWPIVRSKRPRNLPVVGVLAGLALANVAVHWGVAEGDASAVRMGSRAGVYLVVTLILIISGRIVPLFTRNVLVRRGVDAPVSTPRLLGGLAIGCGVISLAIDVVQPFAPIGAWFALATAPLLLARQSGWQLLRILDEPMLWILHLGHAWIAFGFALHGASVLSASLVGAGALHAFTAGAMGTMVLGVMPRVTLGHSNLPIQASRTTCLIFGLVTAGALLRVGGAMIPTAYYPAIITGGVLWAAAWAVFCAEYWRVLVGLGPSDP